MKKRARIIAWGLAGIVIAFSGIRAVHSIINFPDPPLFNDALEVLGWWLTVPIIFAVRLALGMVLIFFALAALDANLVTPNWTIPNPLGVIPASFWESGFMMIWTVGLVEMGDKIG
jgi:hypothetical protein